ncbi:MAG: hypothetical protein GY861_27990 [bacterium]|nr:hypothetical protein [bacterium]
MYSFNNTSGRKNKTNQNPKTNYKISGKVSSANKMGNYDKKIEKVDKDKMDKIGESFISASSHIQEEE